MLNMRFFILFVMSFLTLFSNTYAGSVKEEYELQERCKKSADAWFEKEWGHYSEKNKIILADYECHYNKKLNKCFVVESNITIPKNKKGIKIVSYRLFDINANKIYGQWLGGVLQYVIDMRSSIKVECSSKSEWDLLVKPYMEE